MPAENKIEQLGISRASRHTNLSWSSPPLPPPPVWLYPLARNLTGGTPASKPPASGKEAETIPEQLITATKAAVDMGASFERGKLLPFGDKSYPATAVLAAIKERERREGGESTAVARRRSKHCGPRFCEIIALPENRSRWAEHRTQLTKVELDAMVTGKTRDVLIDTWKQFKDEKVVVSLCSCTWLFRCC